MFKVEVENSSRGSFVGHFLGTVFWDVSKKPGFQNGTTFGPLAIETPIGGAGRGGPK